MKKIVFLILVVILTNSVMALDCDYTDTKLVPETKQYYDILAYKIYDVDPLVSVTSTRIWKEYAGYTWDYSFDLKNNVEYELDIQVTYNNEGKQKKVDLTLDPLALHKVTGTFSQNGIAFDNESIRIKYKNAELMNETTYNNVTFCEICPSGNICLNDGASCPEISETSKECGSGICNIAGKCGQEFIVSCPDGYLNCNDEICLRPSTKEAGQAYKCEWECISGLGEDNICLEEEKPWPIWLLILFIAIIILIISISLYYGRRSAIENDRKRILTEIEKRKTSAEKEIISLKNEMKLLENEKGDLVNTREDIKVLRKQINALKAKLIRDKEEYEKERLKPFKNKQGYKVIVNENGYEIFENSGELFHRWYFRHKHNRKIKRYHEIHHIDFDKRNNDISNLKEITKNEHQRLHRNRYNA